MLLLSCEQKYGQIKEIRLVREKGTEPLKQSITVVAPRRMMVETKRSESNMKFTGSSRNRLRSPLPGSLRY